MKLLNICSFSAALLLLINPIFCFEDPSKPSTDKIYHHGHSTERLNRSAHSLKLNDLSPDHSLKNVRMGESKVLDAFGSHYYFFVYDPILDEAVSKVMLENGGMWEEPLNLMFKSLLDKERSIVGKGVAHHPLVIDAGVNFGAFTLFAASTHSRVIGFEMQPKVLTLVDMGIRLNGYDSWVALYNVGLWDRTGLAFSFDEMTKNLGGTDMKPDDSHSTHVKTQRMDTVLMPDVDVFFMKVDCEGCEPRALLSMDTMLMNRKVKHVAVENYPRNLFLLDMFFMIGYTCETYDDKEDCKFPTMGPQCQMANFDAALQMFKVRQPYSHWNMYMDVHCELTQEPPVSFENLRSILNLEGKLIHGESTTEVYRITDGKRVFVSQLADIASVNVEASTVMNIKYKEMFLYPLKM